MTTNILGIDIGGSSIKAALVDVNKSELSSKIFTLPTPAGARPEAVGKVIQEICRHFAWAKGIGCTFPGVVRKGTVYTAANVDKSWLGLKVKEYFENLTKCPMFLINDADAAGYAEMRHLAPEGRALETSTSLILTFGTGIGSALFRGKILIPNTELGHLIIQGLEAEHFASALVRTREHLDWQTWIDRVNIFLSEVERLLWPDQIIVGGAVSAHFEEFKDFIRTSVSVFPAHFQNAAGILGAALWYQDQLK